MHYDARVTLYGGAAISIGLVAIGTATQPLLAITGCAFAGATLALAALFDHVSTA